MTKQSGLGDNLWVDGYDLSGDIGSLEEIGGGNSPLVVTGINKSAIERLGGLRDGRMNFTAWFNDTADAAHDRFENLPTTDVIATYWRGTTAGNNAASVVAKQVDYGGSRAADGALSFSVPHVANGYALEWGVNLGHIVQGTAGTTTGVDFGAASSFGLQAYLHLISFSGTSITVTIQESANDGSPDAYTNVTGGAFSAMTTVGAQRIATANDLAVEQWLRLSTTGTFSAAAFAVNVVRNEVAGQVF